ncbi:MAG: hypothetical protein ACRDK7_03300 [Solirubrobacteraceae bacterium]
MNDHLSQLQQALSDAARHEYGDLAPGRRSRAEATPSTNGDNRTARRARLQSLRRWPPLVVGLVLAISATAAAAIVVLVNRNSAPLSGTVPGLRVLHYNVPLTPDLEAGDAGWCSDPRFTIPDIHSPYSGGGTCSPAYRPGSPIVLAGGEPISNTQDVLRSSHTSMTAREGHTNLFWGVVTSGVAAIRLSPGHVVTARHDSRLPAGWKAVIAFVSGQIDPVALDTAGHVIATPRGAVPQLARTSTRSVKAGGLTASSPCSIHAPHLSSVTASWGVLATRVPALGSSVTANVLFSCARSWYSIKGYTEAPSAAILLNARNPHARAPALPGLRPTGLAGVFAEDGGAAGQILATRAGRAWLVVQGPSSTIDASLIGALRAEGPAVGSTGHR